MALRSSDGERQNQMEVSMELSEVPVGSACGKVYKAGWVTVKFF